MKGMYKDIIKKVIVSTVVATMLVSPAIGLGNSLKASANSLDGEIELILSTDGTDETVKSSNNGVSRTDNSDGKFVVQGTMPDESGDIIEFYFEKERTETDTDNAVESTNIMDRLDKVFGTTISDDGMREGPMFRGPMGMTQKTSFKATYTNSWMVDLIDENADKLKEIGEDAFSDTKGTWYSGSVAMCVYRGVIDGYEDGTFRGNNRVSSAEMGNMIARAIGYNYSSMGNTWYEGNYRVLNNKMPYAYSELSEAEINSGMTRAEVAFAILSYMNDSGISDWQENYERAIINAPETVETKFKDIDFKNVADSTGTRAGDLELMNKGTLTVRYAASIAALEDMGVLQGYSDDATGDILCRYNGIVTRAEAITLIERASRFAGQWDGTDSSLVESAPSYWGLGYTTLAAKQQASVSESTTQNKYGFSKDGKWRGMLPNPSVPELRYGSDSMWKNENNGYVRLPYNEVPEGSWADTVNKVTAAAGNVYTIALPYTEANEQWDSWHTPGHINPNAWNECYTGDKYQSPEVYDYYMHRGPMTIDMRDVNREPAKIGDTLILEDGSSVLVGGKYGVAGLGQALCIDLGRVDEYGNVVADREIDLMGVFNVSKAVLKATNWIDKDELNAVKNGCYGTVHYTDGEALEVYRDKDGTLFIAKKQNVADQNTSGDQYVIWHRPDGQLEGHFFSDWTSVEACTRPDNKKPGTLGQMDESGYWQYLDNGVIQQWEFLPTLDVHF